MAPVLTEGLLYLTEREFNSTPELPETLQEYLLQKLSLIKSLIIRTPVDFRLNVIES